MTAKQYLEDRQLTVWPSLDALELTLRRRTCTACANWLLRHWQADLDLD